VLARITLDMWRVFVSIATYGSSQKAADALYKSQSAVSHALKKMEAELGHTLFELEGRQLVLTTLGKILLPKAQRLLGEAEGLESLGKNYQAGFLDEIAIACDTLLPMALMQEVIERFSLVHPDVCLRIFEPSLSGTSQLLEQGVVSLGISSIMPADFILEPLMDIHKTCICAKSHPLAAQEQLTQVELKAHTQIVIRDTGQQNISSGWLGSNKRITVSHTSTALKLVERGMGYAWLADALSNIHHSSSHLVKVGLQQGSTRIVRLQIGMQPELAKLQEIADLYALFVSVAKGYRQEV